MGNRVQGTCGKAKDAGKVQAKESGIVGNRATSGQKEKVKRMANARAKGNGRCAIKMQR